MVGLEVWNFAVMSEPVLAGFLSVKSRRAVVFITLIDGTSVDRWQKVCNNSQTNIQKR